jgi:nucleoside-diphosphate kinase
MGAKTAPLVPKPRPSKLHGRENRTGGTEIAPMQQGAAREAPATSRTRRKEEAKRTTSPLASTAMSDRTLVLLKPDTVERGLVGEVLRRFEAKGLRIVAMDLRSLDQATLARHYEEHVGKGFYADLVEFMSRGPVVALVLEGPEDTWDVVRGMMGPTNPRKAPAGTIRGDLGILFTENLVHGSDSLESAQREIAIFFPNL